MKKLLLVPLLMALILAAGLVWFYLMTQPVSAAKTYSNFLIPKGTSASQVGSKLEKAGLIKNALVFRIYLQATGQAGKIQSGEYRLSPSFSLFQVVAQFMKGPLEIWVTIPEGLRHEEIASKFTKALEKDNTFFTEFIELTKTQEGKLYPETYLFPKEASVSAIVNKMIKTYDSKTGTLTSTDNLTPGERLILASIIERETVTDEERPIVAGILIKRLKIGMALQVDASVQYGVANVRCKTNPANCNWWQPITREDLATASPFNTYKLAGLPPTPISNPGLSSIKAAWNPTQSDYLYYIHDSQGKIHYARTLEEHNQNISTYLGR